MIVLIENKAWAWTFWEVEIHVLKKGNYKITVKAEDIDNNKQIEDINQIWNLRGILNNSYHSVNVEIN